MSRQFPETGRSEAAEEGTACHWIGSEALLGRPHTVGEVCPDNGVVTTREMFDAAEEYYETIRSVSAASMMMYVEHRVQMTRIHAECFGTLDCCLHDISNNHLHIFDLKYGHRLVNPFENWQMICYAIGMIDERMTGNLEQTGRVTMTIVQPRVFHRDGPVRSWTVRATDIRAYANRLHGAAALAMGHGASCVSGDQCCYCSARHACDAAQQMAMHCTEYIEMPTTHVLTPEALAIELRTMRRAADAVKYRLSGLEAQAEAILKAGGIVPGWGLDIGQGRLKWSVPNEQVFMLGDAMNLNLRKEPEPITPAQAKKAGLSEEVVKSFASAEKTGAKLMPFDNTIISRVFRTQNVKGY